MQKCANVQITQERKPSSIYQTFQHMQITPHILDEVGILSSNCPHNTAQQP
jgi:hypothetical protein